MKKFMHFYVLICVFALVFGVSGAAMAQTSVGVVDIQKILAESKAGQSVQKQVHEKREQFQKEFTKVEEEMRNSQKTLAEKQKTLSQEEMLVKRQEFEKKLLETRTLVQKRKGALEGAFTKALRQLEKEVLKIVESIAAEKKYDLVLSNNNVFIGNKSLDISSEVLKQLDAKITTVKVEVESK